MGALCTNDKEIHEKLKFLQLGEHMELRPFLKNEPISENYPVL